MENCKADVKRGCTAQPECKKKKVLSSKGNITERFLLLHLFISYLFFILIVYVLYHNYLLVFIDYFLFQCKVYCIID